MPNFVEFMPIAGTTMREETHQRSTDPDDYQHVPRPIAAMAKSFADGCEVAPHGHERDQLLFALTGIMRLETAREAWIVPPDRAVYIPARTIHSVSIRGDVAMRTLYLAPDPAAGLPRKVTVLEVSDLLRALVLALIEEPVLYDEAGRGGAIARLIVMEIARARGLAFVVPMPRDARLQRLCTALLADPACRLTLEGWSETAGASARTLARLFERDLGMSFAAWRQRVRLHHAVEALAEGQPVARVAESCGYRSPSAFAAAFRKLVGLPPSALKSGGRLADTVERPI